MTDTQQTCHCLENDGTSRRRARLDKPPGGLPRSMEGRRTRDHGIRPAFVAVRMDRIEALRCASSGEYSSMRWYRCRGSPRRA